MLKHFKHFNSAALVDAAQGYRDQLDKGNLMMVTLAGAMSTAELGKSLAEMIRQDKVHIISCTGANLEEDLMNLVAHKHYKRIPEYRDLTAEQERELMNGGLNRVTDTCIPEEEAFRRLQKHVS
jgi:deoxyhypusine synthase